MVSSDQMNRFFAKFRAAAESEDSEQIDELCWDWLNAIAKDYGEDGRRARTLLDVAKSMIYA